MTKKHSSRLSGSFIRLLAKGMLAMTENLRDFIELNMDYTTGVRIFDNLTSEQKVLMIRKIGIRLLEPAAKPRRSTAIHEGTIAALFAEMITQIEMELDRDVPYDELCFYWRCTIRDVFLDQFGESFPMNQTLDEWSEIVQKLSDLILDDRDYEEEWITDKSPAKAKKIIHKSRIPKEYFNYIPKEPKPEECQQMIKEIIECCNHVLS